MGGNPLTGPRALRQRLLDLDAVLGAQRQGRLPVKGANVVLVGHSLGALTALLAAGADPVPGIDRSCRQPHWLQFRSPICLSFCNVN